jgi:hypothetical protein
MPDKRSDDIAPNERASANSAVARRLRQEVHFACPICGNPVLTYHHFDPTWAERNHNDFTGMIALCQAHHAEAEGGRWSRDELKEYKTNPPQLAKIAKDFLWRIGPKLLFRLGGNYATSDRHVIVLNGRPILSQERSDEGLALFSLDVFAQDDKLLLQVVENSVSVESLGMWDVQFYGQHNHFIVKPKQGTIALDLHLKRLSLQDFKAFESQDTGGMSPDQIDYVVTNCSDGDGNIVFVDINRAQLYAKGKLLNVRDGMVIADIQITGSVVFENSFAAFEFSGL